MIICNLQGGLGNQMFQYAAAMSLGENKTIYFDVSFFKENSQSTPDFQARTFELGVFKRIDYKFIHPWLLRVLFSKHKKLNWIKNLMPWHVPKLQYINEENIANQFEDGTSFYLHGYFQNPTIFNTIRKKLLYFFEFPSLPLNLIDLEQQIKNQQAVSLHIRRGDYLNAETAAFHGVLPISYYRDAINMLKDKIVDPFFYIFSDDVQWCRKELQFIDHQFIVSELQTPNWADMYLMSICKHNIIANSSFSWWGAWLNENSAKIVIAPKNWFVNEQTAILPKEWVII